MIQPIKPSHHRRALWYLVGMSVFLTLGRVRAVEADVLVLANRTDRPVALTVGAGPFEWLTCVLVPGEAMAFYVPPTEVRVVLHDASSQTADASYACEPGQACFVFRDEGGRLAIAAIGFATVHDPAGQLEQLLRPRLGVNRAAAVQPTVVVYAKLASDDEQPLKPSAWQRHLSERLRDVSRRMLRQLSVSVRCVGYATWDSNDDILDFDVAANEFADEVDPGRAHVAIGFTAQFGNVTEPHGDLGTSHGPLRRHILVREGTGQLLYVDRIEVLFHELGHFLGAAHSPEPDSVMRPRLGDHRAVRKDALIQLDPVNCLAAALVVDGLNGLHHVPESIGDLPPLHRYLLARVYRTLEQAMPEDPVAPRYLTLVRPVQYIPRSGLAEATRRVVQAVLAEAANTNAEPIWRETGDALAEKYVRAAALAAAELPDDLRPRAFLLGLAIALDRYEFFAKNSWLAPIYRAVESDSERAQRLQMLGHPTFYDREDLLAHFLVSAALTALVGKSLAIQAGILKEEQDARAGSGFSFADLAADLAGVEFGVRVLNDADFLERVGREFTVRGYVPDPEGLPEGLSAEAFARRYGGRYDPRFTTAVDAIRELIANLPGYRETTAPYGR